MMFARERFSERLVWIEPTAVTALKDYGSGTLVLLTSGQEIYVSGDLDRVQAALARGDDWLDHLGEVARGVYDLLADEEAPR